MKRNIEMTKLYQELKPLTPEDAIRLLDNVSYHDLKREYKALVDYKGMTVIVAKLPDRLPDRPLDTSPGKLGLIKTCQTKTCNNPVTGKARKCGECKK
jgi:hypothetical protein